MHAHTRWKGANLLRAVFLDGGPKFLHLERDEFLKSIQNCAHPHRNENRVAQHGSFNFSPFIFAESGVPEWDETLQETSSQCAPFAFIRALAARRELVFQLAGAG
jgi:hypothetical protein